MEQNGGIIEFMKSVGSVASDYGIEKGIDVVGFLAKNIYSSNKFQKIFLEAGTAVAEYEKDNLEECEIRQIVFCKDNMLQLARTMKNVSGFKWSKTLEIYLDDILEKSSLPKEQKKSCKKHFLDVVENEIMLCCEEIYQQNLIGETVSEVKGMRQDFKNFTNLFNEYCMEQRNQKLQEHSSRPGRYLLPDTDKISGKKITWKLSFQHGYCGFGSKEERKKEILRITDLWKEERENYPDWYIPPYDICCELKWSFEQNGLLQPAEDVSVEELLEFTYELVWRYETGMKLYESHEQMRIRIIWEDYLPIINDMVNEINQMDSEQKENARKHIMRWFYIGQALLREYREEREVERWQELYRKLEPYKEYGLNGAVELQMEKIKFHFMNLELRKTKKLLEKWNIPNEQYEVCLQAAGIWAELGEVKTALQKMKELNEYVTNKLNEIGDEEENQKERLRLQSFRAGMLRLCSIALQGFAVCEGKYEEYQETINQILEMTDDSREYFDWQMTVEQIRTEILKWHVRQYQQEEVFDINRENVIIFGGNSICEDAYRLYRILDRLALPLHSNHVTLMSDTELPWIQALMQINYHLGINVLIRSTNFKNVKMIVNRGFIAAWEQDVINSTIIFLKDALEKNLEEISECHIWKEGNIYTCILEHVPNMLTRYLSRCPEFLQPDTMMLLKKMTDIPGFDLNRHMDEFTENLMHCISEKTKVEMLGTMLECGIYERNEDHGNAAAFDVFDFYAINDKREQNGNLRHAVSEQQIEKLLVKANHSEYERRMVIPRLQTLYNLGILNNEQQDSFGKLLWNHAMEDINLPDYPKLYLWAFTVLPHPEEVKPEINLKKYFLTSDLSATLNSKGRRGSFYIDELYQSIQGCGKDFWSISEAEDLLQKLEAYWNEAKEKRQKSSVRIVGLERDFNLKTVVKTCIALCSNVSEGFSEKAYQKMKAMISEMKDAGLDILCLEVIFSSETEPEKMKNQIIENLYSTESSITVDAIKAVYIYLSKRPSCEFSGQLFYELVNMVKARKAPGLTSALIMLHNILYENLFPFSEEAKIILDRALLKIEEQTRYQKWAASEKEMKEVIRIRRACANLAWQLSLHCECEELFEGIKCWHEICNGDEFIEVKESWGY